MVHTEPFALESHENLVPYMAQAARRHTSSMVRMATEDPGNHLRNYVDVHLLLSTGCN
jgi:hypothetical protein